MPAVSGARGVAAAAQAMPTFRSLRTVPSSAVHALPLVLLVASAVCSSAFTSSSPVAAVQSFAGPAWPFHLLNTVRTHGRPQILQRFRLRGGNMFLKPKVAACGPALRTEQKTSLSMSTVVAPEAPVERFRKDYKPTDYRIDELSLTFKIEDGATQVSRSSTRKIVVPTRR